MLPEGGTVTAEDIVWRLIERVWNAGDLAALEELFAEPFDQGGRRDTVAGVRAWHLDDAKTWADQRFEVVRLISDGRQVAVQWRATATQVGVWGPIPSTGKTIAWDGVHFFVVRDGRITEMWAMADVFSKALQLGATVTPLPA